MNKLFVSGFPLDITELELARLIAPYGNIETLKIVRDRKTRICKGYAFVEMQTEAGANHAIAALDGTASGERLLTVKLAEEEKPAPAPARYTKVSPVKPAYPPATSDNPRIKRPRRIV